MPICQIKTIESQSVFYPSNHRRSKLIRALGVSAAILIAACDSSVDSPIDRLDADRIDLLAPERIRNAQAVNPAAITALATVNGVEVLLNPMGDGSYRGDVSVPANTVVPVNIQFSEEVDGEDLVLATQTQQINTGSSDNQLTLRRSAYNYDDHDADGDSVSNIIEREENTNPRDASDAPAMLNVNVVAEQPAEIANDSSNRYSVEAAIGNSVKLLERSGNQYRGTFYTVDRAPVSASAFFIDEVTGQRLPVASQSYELPSIFEQQTITFSGTGYQLTDRDGDSQTDLAELIAGTSIFSSENDSSGEVSFTTAFDIPASIENPGSVYAEYRVDGQPVGLTRNSDSYSANSSVASGAIVVLDVALKDNFNASAYLVAEAQKTVQITSGQQVVQFAPSDFNLQIDTDADGVLNYIEREQATNPLAAGSGETGGGSDMVSCIVSDVPAQVVSAGSQVTQSMTDFINCGDAAYELAASDYQFSWNSGDNTIQWVLPATADAGSQLTYTVDVRNPADSSEVYTSLLVNTIIDTDSGCTAQLSTTEIAVSRDLFLQDDEVFDTVQLRVDGDDRVSLLGFSIPSSLTMTGNATLAITVGADEGSGTVNVAQLDYFPWSETDEELQLPQMSGTAGELTGSWQSGQRYEFNLSGLKKEDNGELTLLLFQSSGNDVAFRASEAGDSAVLSVESIGSCDTQ